MATRVLNVTYEINTTCFFTKNKSTNISLIMADVSYNKAAFRMMFRLFNQFKILQDSHPFLAFFPRPCPANPSKIILKTIRSMSRSVIFSQGEAGEGSFSSHTYHFVEE